MTACWSSFLALLLVAATSRGAEAPRAQFPPFHLRKPHQGALCRDRNPALDHWRVTPAQQDRLPAKHRDAWFAGMAANNWFTWQTCACIGVIGASYIPTDWGLEFTGTLALTTRTFG